MPPLRACQHSRSGKSSRGSFAKRIVVAEADRTERMAHVGRRTLHPFGNPIPLFGSIHSPNSPAMAALMTLPVSIAIMRRIGRVVRPVDRIMRRSHTIGCVTLPHWQACRPESERAGRAYEAVLGFPQPLRRRFQPGVCSETGSYRDYPRSIRRGQAPAVCPTSRLLAFRARIIYNRWRGPSVAT